jgi:hypothetical protein
VAASLHGEAGAHHEVRAGVKSRDCSRTARAARTSGGGRGCDPPEEQRGLGRQSASSHMLRQLRKGWLDISGPRGSGSSDANNSEDKKRAVSAESENRTRRRREKIETASGPRANGGCPSNRPRRRCHRRREAGSGREGRSAGRKGLAKGKHTYRSHFLAGRHFL